MNNAHYIQYTNGDSSTSTALNTVSCRLLTLENVNDKLCCYYHLQTEHSKRRRIAELESDLRY